MRLRPSNKRRLFQMNDQRHRAPASVDNIYKLDGRVLVGKAIPFGLQHVLAMFVANVTPVMLIASVAVYNGEAFHRHRHGAAHSGRHAHRRYRHAHPALPRLAHRFASARRDGPELHVPVRHDDAGSGTPKIVSDIFRRQPRRGRVRDFHDPVSDAAQKRSRWRMSAR